MERRGWYRKNNVAKVARDVAELLRGNVDAAGRHVSQQGIRNYSTREEEGRRKKEEERMREEQYMQ